MSIFSRLGAAVALSVLLASPLAAQGTKVGFVNVAQLFAEYGPAQEATSQYQAAIAGYDRELNMLRADYQQQAAQYEQQRMTMMPEARQTREQQLQAKLVEFQEREQELTDLAEQRQSELFAPINDTIAAVLEEIRVEGNYGLILDTSQGVILVADPALDLTQQVLTRLEAGSGSEGGT